MKLLEAQGRVLAEGVAAERDQPPFDRATRDGFAVRAEDLSAADGLRVVGEVRAGEVWRGAGLQAGEALGIMTGAPLPEGADAVVMVEHVRGGGGAGLGGATGGGLRAGENVVPRGGGGQGGARCCCGRGR